MESIYIQLNRFKLKANKKYSMAQNHFKQFEQTLLIDSMLFLIKYWSQQVNIPELKKLSTEATQNVVTKITVITINFLH